MAQVTAQLIGLAREAMEVAFNDTLNSPNYGHNQGLDS